MRQRGFTCRVERVFVRQRGFSHKAVRDFCGCVFTSYSSFHPRIVPYRW